MLDRVLHGFVDAMKCEHRQIEQLLHLLELTLDEASVNGRSLAVRDTVLDQLDKLDHCLAEHFKREEEGGFLEDVMAAVPRFADEAGRLLKEHEEMLRHLRELAREARENVEVFRTDWQSFAATMRNLIRQLTSHELRENSLLQRAANVSNGT
jgi:iron-sulfur cluster repair protein YtfE (RIC family)